LPLLAARHGHGSVSLQVADGSYESLRNIFNFGLRLVRTADDIPPGLGGPDHAAGAKGQSIAPIKRSLYGACFKTRPIPERHNRCVLLRPRRAAVVAFAQSECVPAIHSAIWTKIFVLFSLMIAIFSVH
jgi:hypothetical protein